MKRALLTLMAFGILLPLAAEIARAGGDSRHDSRKKKGRSATARPHEPTFDDSRVKVRDHRDSRGQRNYRDTRDQRSYRDTRGHRSYRDTRGHRDYRSGSHRGNVRVGLRHGPTFRHDRKRWVPGHYVIEERRVRQRDRRERVWVPDRFELRRRGRGRPHRVLVEAGHYETRIIPGRVIVQHVRVWVPGGWVRTR